VSLVERDGRVASFHVANVTAKTVRQARQPRVTPNGVIYPKMGREFAGHSSVNHSADEYVRLGSFVHTNTVENFFSILERGITCTYHQVSEAHLHRYLVEFDFRHNTRTALGGTDSERPLKPCAVSRASA
jgi:hypothetical protein